LGREGGEGSTGSCPSQKEEGGAFNHDMEVKKRNDRSKGEEREGPEPLIEVVCE